MKKYYFVPFYILFFLVYLQAASQNTVEGSVINQNREPVPFANVVLMALDSVTVYKGAVSNEDGSYVFEDVANNSYLLTASYVGYVRVYRQVKIDGNTKVEPLILAEDMDALTEITVTARKPTVTRSVDRITFNVENTTLSTGNSYDILKRTPGVIENQGQLLVKNRPATVYINDRKVYLTAQELQQLLEGFSAENVKSIEVITNPPARYDAEGGAILNIQTSRNLSVGYKGSLNASHTIAVVPKYQIGTSQYYKTDKVNVFGNYNLSYRNQYKRDEGFIEFYEPNGSVDSRWFNNFERDTRTISHSLSTIIDFTLSDISSLSISANLQLTPKSDSDITGLTEIFNPQGNLDYYYTTDSRLKNEQENILLNAAYTTEIGEKGATLAAIANYIIYDDDQAQNLNSRYFSMGNFQNENFFRTNAGQSSGIYTGQIDLSSPWGTTSLETGVKYSGITSSSGMDFFDTNNRIDEFNSQLSDEFDYNENIYAGYFSVYREWEKWSIKGGLRGEYTDVSGASVSLGPVNTQEYFGLFPTFYLMHMPNEDHSYGVDYSRRIARPRFQSLNPYRYFINENNYNVGNPNLMPAISNKINFNYTYKGVLSFDLYWDRADNATAILPFQDNANRVLRSVNANMDFEQQFSFDVQYFDYVKDWWYLYFYGSLFYMQNDFYAVESGNQIVTTDVLSTYLSASNFLTLSKDRTFSGELTASFLPDFVSGSYTFDKPQTIVNLGLRKTFFNNKLVTTLNVEDIFNRLNIPLRSQYLNQNNSFFVAEGETRRLRVGLIYNFGNFRLRDNQRAINAEESERLLEETHL